MPTKTCFQTLLNVPWGNKHPQLRTTGIGENPGEQDMLTEYMLAALLPGCEAFGMVLYLSKPQCAHL